VGWFKCDVLLFIQDYCWYSHLSAELILTATKVYSALPVHCVAITSYIIITILLYGDIQISRNLDYREAINNWLQLPRDGRTCLADFLKRRTDSYQSNNSSFVKPNLPTKLNSNISKLISHKYRKI
jgi:hypothetical protein